jgi:hypothetical protein
MSVPRTNLVSNEVSASRPRPPIQVQYAPLADWFAISGLRRTRTYELLGRGQLRAVKLGNRTLIDVPHGLAYLAQLPEAVITTGSRVHKRGGRPAKNRDTVPARVSITKCDRRE